MTTSQALGAYMPPLRETFFIAPTIVDTFLFVMKKL